VKLPSTVATYCPGSECGRQEVPRAAYTETKACECGGVRIICSRYEWALIDALTDELDWRRSRGELDSFRVVEQYPIRTSRFDIRTREERYFTWHFDAGVIINLPGLGLRCLVEVDGENHYDRQITRDRSKEADAAEGGWARTGGLYVVRNHELRPRRDDGGWDWRAAYQVAAELAREMLGRGLDGDMSRRRW
jgi:hypothetical protein